MKILHVSFLAFFLSACGNDERVAAPEKAAADLSIPKASAEERRFAEELDAILETWMGTPWSYSGTSQTPGEGSIACGYFVTTTLEDAGVELDRVRLAQAASETMILAISASADVKRFSDVPLETFLDRVKNQGEGIYLVGLDNHTGFLKVDAEGEIEFVHSGPGRGVVRERPADAPELGLSRYRVTGKVRGVTGPKAGP